MALIGTQTFERNMREVDGDIGESMKLDHQDLLASDKRPEAPPGGIDLSNLRFSIKSTDMSENMIKFVIEKTILAFEMSHNALFEGEKKSLSQDKDTLICKKLKFFLDSFYKPSWHVICGENYGSFFTHYKGSFIVFCFEGKWITIFRSA